MGLGYILQLLFDERLLECSGTTEAKEKITTNLKSLEFQLKNIWDRIHNTSVSSKLMHGPNKLKCNITLG